VTTFVGVPAMLARLVNSNPDRRGCQRARVAFSSDHLPERFAGACGIRRSGKARQASYATVLLNGYGMVELGGLAMMGVDLSFLRRAAACVFLCSVSGSHCRLSKIAV